MEKKVYTLLKFIQNKNKIPKVIKKELVGIINDLHEQCHLLYSVFDHALEIGGRKDHLGTASSLSSSSDLDYYSSEETDITASNVREITSSFSDYSVMLKKIQETESTNEDLKRQLSNLRQETCYLRDQNVELAGDIGSKRNEDRAHFKGLNLMVTNGEVALLRDQKNELSLQLEKKNNEVSETQKRLKRVEEVAEKQAKAELKIVREKKALCNKVEKLEVCVDTLHKQRKEFNEEMKSKITEIGRLKEDNQKLHTRIAELESLQKQRGMKNVEVKDQQEDVIHR